MITETEVEAALDYLRDHAEAAAKARAERVYVEEYRSVVKAMLMKRYADQTLGAQEREALSDPAYQQHLEAIREAVQADEHLRFMLKAAEAKVEAWRSQSANNRVGM